MLAKKYKNIIFDLGGVLINWKPKEFVKDILKNQNLFEKDFQDFKDILDSKVFLDLDKGVISREQAINSIHDNIKREQFFYLYKNIDKYMYPLDSGLKIFNLIKNNNYKTYVLSNFSKELFELLSPGYKFLDKFDGQVISYQVKAIKPDPEIYEILLTKFNLKPEESIFIDDVPENITGAKKVGIDGIVCTDHYYVLQELKRLKIL